jgi:hypothetical protein
VKVLIAGGVGYVGSTIASACLPACLPAAAADPCAGRDDPRPALAINLGTGQGTRVREPRLGARRRRT